MTRSDRDRAVRLSDFAARARGDPSAHFRDPTGGEYVAVHPFADELELLERLGISPEVCTTVDCYWKRDGDVYFLQVESALTVKREVGLWARVNASKPRYVNFVAIVEERLISRDVVHAAMRALAEFDVGRLELTDGLARLEP